jgi:hypothetical protein
MKTSKFLFDNSKSYATIELDWNWPILTNVEFVRWLDSKIFLSKGEDNYDETLGPPCLG